MMRKLLLLSTALLTMCFGATAQEQKTASTPTVVTDTLHYYFNKFYFKTGISDINEYPYYKCPSATGTAVTHVGSRFEVPAGDSVYVTGLEAFVRKGPTLTGESTSSIVKVGLYLCNLNSNNMPVLPAIDSV